MVRDQIEKLLDHDPRFRWRGNSVTRIENLSDIVFALALGILVSTSTRPQTFSDLNAHLQTIVPVAAGFFILVSIWNAHFVYFRRYGVADRTIIWLNGALLLLVLFFAYPLRFIFDSLYWFVFGLFGDWSHMEASGIGPRSAGIIMGYFALGYCLIYLLISQMFSHALAKADLLDLSDAERAMTRISIWIFRSQILVGTLVGVLAVWTPLHAMAGSLMALIAPLAFLVRRMIKVPATELLPESNT